MKFNSSKERILHKLSRPMTVSELAAEVFMDAHYLGKLLRRFRNEGEVHICGWESDAHHRAVWARGSGKDKARPKAKTDAQISQAYRDRINKIPEKRTIYLAKKRLARIKDRPAATWIPL